MAQYGIVDHVKHRVRELSEKYTPVFYIAPTGFGKTTLYMEKDVLKELIRSGKRVIHVLPLRSIVVDTLERLIDYFDRVEVNYRDYMGYQAGLDRVLLYGKCVDKDPYMLSTYNVTTYDSYSLTLLVSPVPELSGPYGHYDLGYMALTSAINLFDEVHVLLDTHEDYKGLYFLQGVTYYLSLVGSRLVYMSATVHPGLIEVLLKPFRGRGSHRKPYIVIVGSDQLIKRYREWLAKTVFRELIEAYEVYPGSDVCVSDKELCDKLLSYPKYVKTVISGDNVLDIALSVISGEAINGLSRYTRDRVAVIVNTVNRAIEVYRCLKEFIERKNLDYKVYLLHSRIGENEKIRRLESIREDIRKGRNIVVVSTQVIEAGVNISFRTMITEVSIIESLIQRIGRVARDNPVNECIDGPCLVIISISKQSIKDAKSIYGDLIEYIVKKLTSRFRCNEVISLDWKIGIEPSIYDLLLEAGLGHVISRDTREIDYTYLGYEDIITKLIEPAIRNTISYTNMYNILENLEKTFGGSIIRSSSLLKLVIVDENSKEIDRVTVPLRWLLHKGSKYIETRDGVPCYYITRCSDGKCKGVVECIDLGYHDLNKLIESLHRHPLITVYRLQKRLYDKFKDSYLQGLVIKGDNYDREYGLP